LSGIAAFIRDRGRFLDIKARQTSKEKMPKNRAEKTAWRFSCFCEENFDLLPCKVCTKIIKVKLLICNLPAFSYPLICMRLFQFLDYAGTFFAIILIKK
jgi:hypothetical protein